LAGAGNYLLNMARVFGESGRYVSNEAARQSRELVIRLAVSAAVLGLVEGAILSSMVPLGVVSGWFRTAVAVLTIGGMWLFVKWTLRKLADLDMEREAMRRGAAGEWQVGDALSNLPDEFFVVNDVSTSSGNLDHIVIGPTGVFVLDAKNWRGVVAADGSGELLLNGKATEKPVVRQLVGRMMGIREKVVRLAPGLDPYFQAVLVFTAARVDASWGATHNAHCVRGEQLHNYIVEKNNGRLGPGEVERIAQAFLGLAHMDREFTRAIGQKSVGH
jgi:hypothetical protein